MRVVIKRQQFLSAAPSSLYIVSAPGWVPSHRIQSFWNFIKIDPSHGLLSFKNWSSVGPFHVVQSSMNTPFQCGSHTGHRSWQEPAAVWTLTWWAAASFRACLSAVAWCSPQTAVWLDLLQCSPPWAARGPPVSPWSSLKATGESLLWCMKHFLSLLLCWPWCLQGCFSCILLAPLSHSCCALFFTLS